MLHAGFLCQTDRSSPASSFRISAASSVKAAACPETTEKTPKVSLSFLSLSLSLSLSPPRMTPPKGGRPQGRVLVSGLLVHDVHLVLSGRPAHWPKHSGVRGSAKTATVWHPPSVPPGFLDGFGVQTHSNILSGPYASSLSLSFAGCS